MQPLSLRLRGFRGIRDGLGLDELTLDLERLADGAALVAIAGANGRGKSTVMDNLHPYLTMPSRALGACRALLPIAGGHPHERSNREPPQDRGLPAYAG